MGRNGDESHQAGLVSSHPQTNCASYDSICNMTDRRSINTQRMFLHCMALRLVLAGPSDEEEGKKPKQRSWVSLASPLGRISLITARSVILPLLG
jgi:hypothetical protein